MRRPTKNTRCLQPPCRYISSSRAFMFLFSCCSCSGGGHLAGAFLPHHTTTTTTTSIPGGKVVSPPGPAPRIATTDVRLEAKKSRGGGRKKGRGRRGRQQQQPQDEEAGESAKSTSASVAVVPPPKSYRQTSLRIRPLRTPSTPPASSRPHIDIAMYDIDDADWWEAKTLLQEAMEESGDSPTNNTSENPFGTRAWPPSLVVAQLLAGLPLSDIAGRTIVELGCGTGLVSITAAGLGANAVATDISPLTLTLTRRGWEETKKKTAKGWE